MNKISETDSELAVKLEVLSQSAVMGAYCDTVTKAEIYPLTCDCKFFRDLATELNGLIVDDNRLVIVSTTGILNYSKEDLNQILNKI